MNRIMFTVGLVVGLLAPSGHLPADAVCGDWDWDITPVRRVDSTWSGEVDDFSSDAEVTSHVGAVYGTWNAVVESPFAWGNGGNLNIGDTQDLTDVPNGQAWFTDANLPFAAGSEWRTENGENQCGNDILAAISYLDTDIPNGFTWWAEAAGLPGAMQYRVKTFALHEVGHNAGINHLAGDACSTAPGNSDPVMAPFGLVGPNGCVALRAADRTALDALYP